MSNSDTDIVNRLRFQHVLMDHQGKTWMDAAIVRPIMQAAAEEIERLRALAGVVSDGPSFADIRRDIKKAGE